MKFRGKIDMVKVNSEKMGHHKYEIHYFIAYRCLPEEVDHCANNNNAF